LPEEIASVIDARPNTDAAPGRAPIVRFSKYDKDELEAVTAEVLADLEQEFVEGLLKSTGGNVSRAATVSGIHRSQLQRMIARQRK
jgi:DNA-binding protein Fis